MLLRLFFAFFILVHGLIHAMGFAKAFGYGEKLPLSRSISKPAGAVWLLTMFFFVVAAVLVVFQVSWWWAIGLLAAVVSQMLLFTAWKDARFGTIANMVVLLGTILAFGAWSFERQYQKDVKAGLATTANSQLERIQETDLQPLPLPVQNYLRKAGVLGKPKVRYFILEFEGEIRGNDNAPWMPFTCEQYNFLEHPTRLFFMNARMKGMPVAGYHHFIDGKAVMDIRLFSLFKVQSAEGPEMDTSETVTFFNDMCCMAPATLIDPRIQWLQTDSSRILAAFSNKGVTVSAWLHFNEQGDLVNFISNDRYATQEDGTMKKFPWLTPMSDFRTTPDGYRLPHFGEAVYRYTEGDYPYGKFRLKKVAYR